MLNLLNSIYFILAQNEAEKSFTILGLTLIMGFIFYILVDTLGKNKWVPKGGNVKTFLICLFVIVIIALTLYIIFNK